MPYKESKTQSKNNEGSLKIESHKKNKKLKINWKYIVLIIWTIITFILILPGDPKSFFAGIGVSISGLSTFIFWLIRNKISFKKKNNKNYAKWKYILIGSLGAFWVELEFWILEKLSGVSLAADSNLLINMLIMMPWYIAMVASLWVVSNKYEYTFFEFLIFGAIYDFCADGIIGSIFSGQFSFEILLLLIIIFPEFLLCYSFIVIPPTYYLKLQNIQTQTENKLKRYIFAFIPLFPLIIWWLGINLMFTILINS
jgi:hypothetical protein